MNAAGDRTEAATKTLTGIPLISTLAPALTMWTAVPDKNKTNMNEQSTPIRSCKRSDSRLPARIPGKKWQISARISESPQFSITEGTRAEPASTPESPRIFIRITHGCRRHVCSNEHVWANAPA